MQVGKPATPAPAKMTSSGVAANTASGMTGPAPAGDILNAKKGDGKAVGNSFQEALEKAVSGGDDKKLQEACRQFEALFIYQLMERMRATVPKNDFWGDSSGVQIFQGMMDEELAKGMSQAGGIGLGKMLYEQLKPKDNIVKPQDVNKLG